MRRRKVERHTQGVAPRHPARSRPTWADGVAVYGHAYLGVGLEDALALELGAGVVHEHVDGPQLLLDCGEGGLDALGVAGVHDERGGAAGPGARSGVHLCLHLAQLVGRTAHQCHYIARLGKPRRHRAADAHPDPDHRHHSRWRRHGC
jgi:hypothetical protein